MLKQINREDIQQREPMLETELRLMMAAGSIMRQVLYLITLHHAKCCLLVQAPSSEGI